MDLDMQVKSIGKATLVELEKKKKNYQGRGEIGGDGS